MTDYLKDVLLMNLLIKFAVSFTHFSTLIWIFCCAASKTKEVNLWTFKGGNNKEWLVELSSEHQDHPLRETLMVKNLPSGSYDENGAFDAGDSQTTYNLIFRGKHTYELHYIEAQFQTAASGEKVEVTAFNGNDEVESWVRAVPSFAS